jgi:hypothetical protein
VAEVRCAIVADRAVVSAGGECERGGYPRVLVANGEKPLCKSRFAAVAGSHMPVEGRHRAREAGEPLSAGVILKG